MSLNDGYSHKQIVKKIIVIPNTMENIALFSWEEWDLVWEHNLLNQIIVFVAMMYVWHIAELVINGLRKYLFITFNIKKMYICCP